MAVYNMLLIGQYSKPFRSDVILNGQIKCWIQEGRKLEKFKKFFLIKLNTHARQGVVIEFELSSATKDLERKTSLTPPRDTLGF